MYENMTTTVQASSYGGAIVSAEELAIVWFVVFNLLEPILAVLGTVSNVLNLTIFSQLGLKQSVNVSLWSLSLSDFVYSLISIALNITHHLATSELSKQLPIDLVELNGILNWYRRIFFDMSSWITTYIALARCCCVAMPLKFSNVFRVKRTISILICILIINVALPLPVLTNVHFKWEMNPGTNRSQLVLQLTQFFAIKDWNDVFNRTIVPIILLLIVFICSVILANSLSKASKRRNAMIGLPGKGSQATKNPANQKTQYKRSPKAKGGSSLGAQTNSQDRNYSNKELQIIKAVTLVMLFLALTLLVYTINALAELCVPELTARAKYKNAFYTISSVSRAMAQFNASINIFIYVKFNSGFRKVFRRLLGLQ